MDRTLARTKVGRTDALKIPQMQEFPQETAVSSSGGLEMLRPPWDINVTRSFAVQLHMLQFCPLFARNSSSPLPLL